MRLKVFIILVGIFTLGIVANASAYTIGGLKWPKKVITYHNSAKQHDWAVSQAVKAWNESGAKVKFKKAPKAKADVLVTLYPKARYKNQLRGQATLGYVPRGINPKRDPFTKGRGGGRMYLANITPEYNKIVRWEMSGVIAHEFGHILGLGHQDKSCATLNSIVKSRCSPKPQRPWQYHCRLLERDDIRGVVKRYGGKIKVGASGLCDKWNTPSTPQNLSATQAGDQVELSWNNPSSYILQNTYIAIQLDRCPQNPQDAMYSNIVSSEANSPQKTTLNLKSYPSGKYCVAIWGVEHNSRFSKTSAFTEFDFVADEFEF